MRRLARWCSAHKWSLARDDLPLHVEVADHSCLLDR
jgi:hypothetical protein